MKITIILLLSTIVILFVKNIQGYNIRILRLPSTDRLKLLPNKECLFIQLDPATQLDIAYQYKKQNPKTKLVMYDNIVKRISAKSKVSITQIKKCIKNV